MADIRGFRDRELAEVDGREIGTFPSSVVYLTQTAADLIRAGGSPSSYHISSQVLKTQEDFWGVKARLVLTDG